MLLHPPHAHTNTRIHTCTMQARTRIHVLKHTFAYTHTRARAHTHTHTPTHTYTYGRVDMQAGTQTHTHTPLMAAFCVQFLTAKTRRVFPTMPNMLIVFCFTLCRRDWFAWVVCITWDHPPAAFLTSPSKTRGDGKSFFQCSVRELNILCSLSREMF